MVLPFLLLMALVLVLTGLLWTIFQDGVARIGTAAVPEQNPSVQEPAGDAAPTPNTTVKLPQESQFVPPDEAQWGVLDAGYERLLEGMPGSAVALFRSAQKDPLNNPAERFAARVGEAEALLVQDERNEAVSVLDDALKEPEGVAEPWRAVARDLRLRILRGEDVGAPVLFARVLEYAERNMETAKEVPLGRGAEIASATSTSPVTPTPSQSSEATGIRLEVSGSRYLLTVLEGDRTLGIFPVGLGRNRATPMGDFEVVNKILEPDWYNRGRVVKAGDPDNPLGELWVGLGEDGRPTSYGIHPTGDADSVGRDRSAGCIRMRPDDARKVFGWVKVGTPVRIGP